MRVARYVQYEVTLAVQAAWFTTYREVCTAYIPVLSGTGTDTQVKALS
jgi:hypothetical protein